MSINFSFSGSLNKKKIPLFVPYNGKIADITHADTNTHYLNLTTALSETRKIVMLIIGAQRISGTGNFRVYPNEGATYAYNNQTYYSLYPVVIADGSQRLQYNLSAANDDFDLYCFGYVVEA